MIDSSYKERHSPQGLLIVNLNNLKVKVVVYME